MATPFINDKLMQQLCDAVRASLSALYANSLISVGHEYQVDTQSYRIWTEFKNQYYSDFGAYLDIEISDFEDMFYKGVALDYIVTHIRHQVTAFLGKDGDALLLTNPLNPVDQMMIYGPDTKSVEYKGSFYPTPELIKDLKNLDIPVLGEGGPAPAAVNFESGQDVYDFMLGRK